jgi:hypothetical protein
MMQLIVDEKVMILATILIHEEFPERQMKWANNFLLQAWSRTGYD